MVTNDRTAVAVGSAVWAVLLVVALLVRDDLVAQDRGWWVATCASGLVLGLVGLAHLQWRAVKGWGGGRRPPGPDQSWGHDGS